MENDENKVKFTEKFLVAFRKKWLVNGTKTILIIAILLAAYIALNLWVKTLDLPEIDVTENKIYTLSDESKKAISNINKEVKIYCYGFEEGGSLIDLLEQYSKTNENIKFERLTEESNYAMVQEYDLKSGYYVLIFKSGDSEKVIDASTDFSTYDYTTNQSIDTTEQTITNSILAVTEEVKPKVYFVEGHGEYTAEQTESFRAYLSNETFEIDTLNITTKGFIPEDCNILAIISPATDFLDSEVNPIKDYINKGGNIYFSMDVISENVNLANIKSILGEYGVSVKNGYILEYDENKGMSDYPYIFMPEVSSSHKITSDIYTDSTEHMWLVFSGKLEFADEATLESLNVEKETLISSSEKTAFVTDLSNEMDNAADSAEFGAAEIGAAVTKKNGDAQSKLIIVASGSFISDYTISYLSSYPLSYLGRNRDFAINSMAYLGEKENTLTIRKDMANSTYLPTETQNRIVMTIIFTVPIIIIFIGIMVGNYRRKRK